MSESRVLTKKKAAYTAKIQIDLSWKGVYRVGGLALAAAGVLYLIGSSLGYYLAVPPGNSQAYFQALGDHQVMAQAAYWSFMLAAVLFIPAILGLYLSLKRSTRMPCSLH